MNRVTQAELQALVDQINTAAKAPATPWTKLDKPEDGRTMRANIGNYHLSGAYGGVSLHRMVTDGGGVVDVFQCGHTTRRDLANRMRAFLTAINF